MFYDLEKRHRQGQVLSNSKIIMTHKHYEMAQQPLKDDNRLRPSVFSILQLSLLINQKRIVTNDCN